MTRPNKRTPTRRYGLSVVFLGVGAAAGADEVIRCLLTGRCGPARAKCLMVILGAAVRPGRSSVRDKCGWIVTGVAAELGEWATAGVGRAGHLGGIPGLSTRPRMPLW